MVRLTDKTIPDKPGQHEDSKKLYKDLYRLALELFGEKKVTHGSYFGEVLVHQRPDGVAVQISPRKDIIVVKKDVYFDRACKVGSMLENKTGRTFTLVALY